MEGQQSQMKRSPGRPATGKGRKPSLNVTISQEVADFLTEYGKDHNVSAYVERLIRESLEWKYR